MGLNYSTDGSVTYSQITLGDIGLPGLTTFDVAADDTITAGHGSLVFMREHGVWSSAATIFGGNIKQIVWDPVGGWMGIWFDGTVLKAIGCPVGQTFLLAKGTIPDAGALTATALAWYNGSWYHAYTDNFGNAQVAKSTDGVSWTKNAVGPGKITSLVGNATWLVAFYVPISGSPEILMSHDGVTWIINTSPWAVSDPTIVGSVATKRVFPLPAYTGSDLSFSVGVPASLQLLDAYGPNVYSYDALPTGLTLSSSGVVGGTPTVPGVFVVHLTLAGLGGSTTVPVTFTVA